MTKKDIEEKRQRILDEMNARRIDHKTYIDSEWLLNEYETALTQHHEAELEKAYERGYKQGKFDKEMDDTYAHTKTDKQTEV